MIAFGLAAGACVEPSLTTDTRSSSFGSEQEKLEFLRRYVPLPSAVEASEFHVVYHDNSRGLPGPSDWDIRLAVKVAPASLAIWLDGFEEVDPHEAPESFPWIRDLTANADPRWQVRSPAHLYKRPSANVLALVHESEGILFKWVRSEAN